MSNLGARIREKRKREGLSLREAGEASGVAFSTLGRIENGGETTLKIAQRVEAWLNDEAPVLPPPPMNLRDWFAGQVLAEAFDHARNNIKAGAGMGYLPEEWAAKMAYGLADAMLAERAKAQPNPGGMS